MNDPHTGNKRNIGDQVRETSAAALETAKTTVTEAIETTKAKANEALVTARESAAKVGARTNTELQNNPLAFVAGGIAIGAAIGALLPRTEREEQLLGSTGKMIKTTARNAVTAAKSEGGKKLEALGITKDAAKSQLDQLLTTISDAASEAGSAAGKAAAAAAKPRSSTATSPVPESGGVSGPNSAV